MWRDTSTAIGILAFAPLGTPSPAMADPPPAEIDWSGFYAGVQLGGGLSLVDVNDPFGASLYGDTVRTPGTLGGFQAGYNWQWDAFLLGLETDVDLASMSGTNTCLAFSGFYVSANCQAGVDALGTLTGRLGIAFGPAGSTLLYGKAGLAWMYGNLETTPNGGFGLPDSGKRGIEWGYTLGAGAEQALDPNWSVRAEYDFLSFATADFSAPASLITAAFANTPGAASQFSQDFSSSASTTASAAVAARCRRSKSLPFRHAGWRSRPAAATWRAGGSSTRTSAPKPWAWRRSPRASRTAP
jgi:opacity protein-like surface antigen